MAVGGSSFSRGGIHSDLRFLDLDGFAVAVAIVVAVLFTVVGAGQELEGGWVILHIAKGA